MMLSGEDLPILPPGYKLPPAHVAPPDPAPTDNAAGKYTFLHSPVEAQPKEPLVAADIDSALVALASDAGAQQDFQQFIQSHAGNFSEGVRSVFLVTAESAEEQGGFEIKITFDDSNVLHISLEELRKADKSVWDAIQGRASAKRGSSFETELFRYFKFRQRGSGEFEAIALAPEAKDLAASPAADIYRKMGFSDDLIIKMGRESLRQIEGQLGSSMTREEIANTLTPEVARALGEKIQQIQNRIERTISRLENLSEKYHGAMHEHNERALLEIAQNLNEGVPQVEEDFRMLSDLASKSTIARNHEDVAQLQQNMEKMRDSHASLMSVVNAKEEFNKKIGWITGIAVLTMLAFMVGLVIWAIRKGPPERGR